MRPKLHILTKSVFAVILMAALLFLTTANFWTYNIKKENQAAPSATNPAEEEPGSKTSVPAPVEEKNPNGLQNLSEYLHDNYNIGHPVGCSSFGNRHDIINYPIHHAELVTPPPKAFA